MLVAGAVISWLRAPPSDQATNVYTSPFSVWGDGAPSEIDEPMISVRTNGVVWPSGPAVSTRPGGSLASVRSTVSGKRKTLVVSLSPPASVAVSRISRCVGYSCSGAVNVPLAPVNDCTVCAWQFAGQ